LQGLALSKAHIFALWQQIPFPDSVKPFGGAMSKPTIYEVLIYHANGGRRVVIREVLYGFLRAGNPCWPKVVADFVCIDSNEADWLERHGKQPWVAYRRMTAIANSDGEFDQITMHQPGSYLIPDRERAR
jgi:hypothetical protein